MALNKKQARHKWALDFTVKVPAGGDASSGGLADLGYRKDFALVADERARSDDKTKALVNKKSWDIALAPVKQLPMNLFIMWMAGNTISIFPIMMVGMMFVRPIQALLQAQQTFKMIECDNAFLPMIVYVVGNILCLGLAVYKCQVMGLLPTHASDWLAFVEPQQRMEWVGGGAIF